MAVTQDSDGGSKKSAEEPSGHCSREGVNPGPSGLVQERKSDGPPAGAKGMRKDDGGTVKTGKRGGITVIKNRSDVLSDIDDIEVVGYLNTKEEINLKRILWETMNEKYIKVKKQKRAAETKKVASVKGATKTTDKEEPEKHSSRINYDAIKSLVGDMHEESCEAGSYVQRDASRDDETPYQFEDEDFYDDFDF